MKKLDTESLEKMAKQKNIDKDKIEKMADSYKGKSENELSYYFQYGIIYKNR